MGRFSLWPKATLAAWDGDAHKIEPWLGPLVGLTTGLINGAPHNFYGHLCTMMNAHFAAAVPNLRIMEIGIDRLPWDDELFTTVPKIENGHLVMPDTPGWGITPNEEALKAHPPKQAGLLDYGRKSP